MQARRHNLIASRRSRGGFTMIELLVVITIIALLIGISYVVLADSLVKARVEATRATIRQLDSSLQERIEAFDRINFRPQAQQLQVLYAAGGNTPPTISLELAELLIRKDRYRAAFPQRLEDLWGLDVTADTADDAPLWTVWKNRTGATAASPRPTGHDLASESSEMLYLAMTEGGSFGLPTLGIDRINPRHIRDVDGDGVPEFHDEWGTGGRSERGQPLRFYNWPTRLIRPGGDLAAIDLAYFQATVGVLMPDAIEPPTDPLTATTYNHPLNQDPDDPTGGLSATMSATNVFTSQFDLVNPATGSLFVTGEPFNEDNYHTVDTYHIPLIVSAGEDNELGLEEPTAAGAARLAQPLADLDHLYDNITNRQR